MSDSRQACSSCYGSGEIVTDEGPIACPDCFGQGIPVGGGASIEWRLRELENRYRGDTREVASDVSWLLHEVRAARQALLDIMTLCDDAPAGDTLAREIKYRANEALRVWSPAVE